MHARWKNEVKRNYLLTTHVGYSWCPITNTILKIKKNISFFALYGCSKEHANAVFGHPYKIEKETPFYFQDGICDRAPRLTYEGGQEVISRNFIFPPCVHFLHLGAKMQRVYGYIQNINFKSIFTLLNVIYLPASVL